MILAQFNPFSCHIMKFNSRQGNILEKIFNSFLASDEVLLSYPITSVDDNNHVKKKILLSF